MIHPESQAVQVEHPAWCRQHDEMPSMRTWDTVECLAPSIRVDCGDTFAYRIEGALTQLLHAHDTDQPAAASPVQIRLTVSNEELVNVEASAYLTPQEAERISQLLHRLAVDAAMLA